MKCMVCGENFYVISYSHLRKHRMTLKQYKERFKIINTVDSSVGEKISKINKGRINMGDTNPAKREGVRKRISSSVKKKWDSGAYGSRINGMIGKGGQLHPNYKQENHTPLFLARNNYAQFLSQFQNIKICSRCGAKDKKTNVHHIDENHSNFLVSNLEPLCVPCHVAFHYTSIKQPFIEIGRLFVIDAAHWLPNYDGLCSNCHGHRWQLEIELKKRVDPKTRMVMDFVDLKRVVEKYIIEVLDHGLINDKIGNPTAENIVIWIWEKLMFDALLKGISRISLWETEKSKVSINVSGMLSIFEANIEEYVEIDWRKK